MKEIDIVFKNVYDFRARIANLWKHQKDDEIYNFTFLDKETEVEFENLMSEFTEG